MRSLEDVRVRTLQALATIKTIDGKYTETAARYLKYAEKCSSRTAHNRRRKK
ncbi:MAG: hypothetical protein RMI04_03960 [Thermofilaceae archaeon]|nr:hypothetical protein [Thermofilaceae archaeon]